MAKIASPQRAGRSAWGLHSQPRRFIIPSFKPRVKSSEPFAYEGADHAFGNDTNAARYNKEAAQLAWKRPVGFLKK